MQTAAAIALYFTFLLIIALVAWRKRSSNDFHLGGRNLNFYLTAFSAHASDMSAWLIMGYPAAVAISGIGSTWTAVGLLFFMYVNWQFIAPKIRRATEAHNSSTLSSFFASHFQAKGIRILSAIMAFFFFTIYLSAQLVGLGEIFGSLFHIPFSSAISIGIVIALIYPLIGGYLTLAWTDLFQGLFLLAMIIMVPLHLLGQGATLSLPSYSIHWTQALFLACGWGLGYFGQPHIITKFMGIRHVHEMHKSKWVGISWMTLALAGATLVGLLGYGSPNPEMIFADMVQSLYAPFFAAFILCAVLAATISVMGSQMLVLTSSLTEDFWKRFDPRASDRKLLLVSRLGIIAFALIAFVIAYYKISSIYTLVFYAWTGLGCSFGPLLILSLYSKSVTKAGAYFAILFGGLFAAVWPLINHQLLPSLEIPAMLPGFAFSLIGTLLVSRLFKR